MPFFKIDDQQIEFSPGQTVIQAARDAGVYIPHLCFHPDFKAHGSCRVCIVRIKGLYRTACTTPVVESMEVININDEVQQHRMQLLEMLFIEGNHVCPSCEKSGSCTLQSVAEFCGLLSPSLPFKYPHKKVDASHADYLLDFNRCILCELCVRASSDIDLKSVFAISGRGLDAKLVVNSDDGKLVNSAFEKSDRAASICPVGVILPKQQGFITPIGHRKFDLIDIDKRQDD